MSSFVAPVRRKKAGRGHYYLDAHSRRIPGVTTILNDGLPKPALVKWAGRTVAETAINRWEELGELPVADRLKTLIDSPWAERDAAANRGTEIHAIADRLVHGDAVDVPDELAGHVSATVALLDRFDPRPILTERVCFNLTDGWAGTFDMLADFPGSGLAWVDWKTGKGVYGDFALQLSAYARAEFYLDDDGAPQPLPRVDRALVGHIRADGADLYPIDIGPHIYRVFRYCQMIAGWANETSKGVVGEALMAAAVGVAS
jgi:hypothetical protein